MAVLGRLLVGSAERLDLPDLLSLDSYAAGDWKYFLKGLVGDSRPYILKGFDIIDPQNAIGTQSCSIRVADSVVFYPGSNAGGFFHGLQEGHVQATPLVPELRKNAVNYVYLTLSTFNTSVDTRAFWDPDKDGGVGGEFTQDINTESVLKVEVNVSTGSFPVNTIPVAKITVGPVTITAIEDARDLMFRLGTGGISPNPFSQFAWKSQPANGYERAEPPTTMQAGGVNPFQGADKNILTLKEWMDAVMSKLRELGGTTYWYEDTSSFGIISGFFDAVATAFKSKGQWLHDSSTPGLLTWTEDLNIKMASDPRTYIVRNGNKTLADEQVMYVPMVRNQPINPTDDSVSWTNGQPYVNTVGGAVGLFTNLSKGDWIKKANDSFDKFVRVEEFYDAINLGGSTTTAANARSIRLSSNYLGLTGVEKARYDKGAYLATDVIVSDRNNVNIYNAGGNFHWLAMRSDTIENISNAVTTALTITITEHDGSTAKITSSGAHGLVDGDRVTITGSTNFDGTYAVEVETSTIFYISKVGSILADDSGSAFYATITTAARSTPYGFQEESANHGLKTDDSVIIAGATGFNGSYKVSVRSTTSYTIPVGSNVATVTTGTSSLARLIVRTEGSVSEVSQGQIVDISDVAADNMRQYIGMASLSETSPTYSISGTYNTLHGMANYNGGLNDNLTLRVSKLTAMMADKAQDKTVKYIPTGITSVTNTTNGLAQEVTFNPSGATLTLVTPGSTGQAVISLPNTAPGISLLANQAAYVIIDRNNTSTPSIVVSNISSCPINENLFVIATRLSTTDVYLWDGSLAGPKESSGGVKIIGGGTLSVSSGGFSTIASNTTASSQGFVVRYVGDLSPVAQSFLVPSNSSISNVRMSLRRNGSPTGTFRLALFNTVLSLGQYVPTGSPIAFSTNNINAATMSTSLSNIDFAFSGTPVSSGQYYAFAFDNTNITFADTSNAILTELENADVVPGTVSIASGTFATPGTWVAFSQDLKYEVQATSSASLSFTNDMYVEIKGLSYTDNIISVASSPIAFPNDLDVAYVIPNALTGGPTLGVTVGALSSVPKNAVVLARREGSDIIVGSSSTRIIPGESKKLYSGISIQNLAYIGAATEAVSSPSYSSNIRGVSGENLTARVGTLTNNQGDSQEDRSSYLRSDNPVTWTGTQLQFTSNIVLEIINTKSGTLKAATILVANSPITLADGESAWVSIDRTLATENLTVNLSGTTPIPAQSQANKDVIVIARRKDALGAGYLHIPLHKQVLEPGQTVRLGASGSGSGSGNEILETLKNHFIDATFDLLTPNIFSVDAATKVDGTSTGSYSLITKTFDFASTGQTMISTQSADTVESLANTNALSEVELLAFWNKDFIDTAATYEVSRNGGNEWQAMTMERVGTTELYRGIYKFVDESVNQNLFNQAVSDATRDLNATTQQEISQRFVIPSGTKMLVKDLVVALTKTGSPTGNLYVSLYNDNAGDPSTVIVESNAISIAALVTGNNTINLPDVYLAAGTYHIKFRTDATYKGVYSVGVTSLATQVNSAGSAPVLRTYNGTVWADSGTDNLTYTLRGVTIDLRVRITSSMAAKLDGYGLFYDKSVGNISAGNLQREIFHFNGSSNQNEFTITKFVPNADLLKVYDINSGQVYMHGVWSLQGQKVVFEVGQFNMSGETVTLVFDQTQGGAFDNSDLNGLLLANNHLGSTDGGIDKSVNGRGIFLRRPDGTLREIAIDDNDNIVIFSV